MAPEFEPRPADPALLAALAREEEGIWISQSELLADVQRLAKALREALAEIRRLQGLADLRRKAEEQLLRERTELAAEVGRTNSEINRVMEVGQNEIADLMARLSVDNGMMQATEDRADKAEKIVAYFREALQDMVDDGDVDPVTRIWAQELLEGAK